MLQIKTISKNIFRPSPSYYFFYVLLHTNLARGLTTISEETTQRKHTHTLHPSSSLTPVKISISIKAKKSTLHGAVDKIYILEFWIQRSPGKQNHQLCIHTFLSLIIEKKDERRPWPGCCIGHHRTATSKYSLVFKYGGRTKEGFVTQENSGPTKIECCNDVGNPSYCRGTCYLMFSPQNLMLKFIYMFCLASHFLVYVYVMFGIRHVEKGTWMKQDIKRRGQKKHSKRGDKQNKFILITKHAMIHLKYY